MFTELVMEWMLSFFSERQRQQTACCENDHALGICHLYTSGLH